MDHPQSREALAFFNRVAALWDKRDDFVAFARHDYCLKRLSGPGPLRLLDLGCGTGALVCAAARQGHLAEGIDFSPEMLRLAEARITPEIAAQVSFRLAAFEDFAGPSEPIDILTANGFIEYLSLDALGLLFERTARWLTPGGELVLHARNRLFNLSSANEYTRREAELGTLPALAEEARLFGQGLAKPALWQQLEVSGTRLPPFDRHPDTGVDVSVRHQFTPGELAGLAADSGFSLLDCAGIHFHAFPPAVQQRLPEAHERSAKENHGRTLEDPAFLPRCSSFMMSWSRRG